MAGTDRGRFPKAARRAARHVLNRAMLAPGLHALARKVARRGYISERVYAGVPLERTVDLDVAGARIRYALHTGDYVGMPLYWRGPQGYEPETFAYLRARLATAEVFYDIGANTGIYSLFAAACFPHLRVWAFEPNPQSLALLGRNVALNRMGDRVTVSACAIGDSDGTTSFDIPEGVFATSAALAGDGAPARGTRRIDIAAATLDRFCETAPLPDLIKLDVEGFEDRALSGMQRVIATARPDLIVEVLDDAPRRAIEALLLPHGYRFGQLTAKGVVWSDTLAGGPSGIGRNWVCSTAGRGGHPG